ncbi:nucleoside-diphosphate-sugar epimerase [Natronocella acetinitrilica]|uniref:Nucleoside-diphosphate-sugar epimerase n=1 Tax=Natronocella acetinitrilica TaxID=414046 RepID=A0AAE3G231_9GAMM|nr:nucleoside-diphosphate-sugar epimerase [Natronocella acetinitrilica]
MRRLEGVSALHVKALVRDQGARLPEGVTPVLAAGDQALQQALPLDDVDVVVHCAARAHIMRDVAEEPLAEFRKVNAEGTISLAQQAAQAGVRRFVFLSSIKVNGESTPVAEPFRPNDLPAPQDAYGQSKQEAEEGLGAIMRDKGMEVVIVRPPLVYGPGVKANFARLMRLVELGLPLPLASVDNRRSLVGLDNLVDMLIQCIHAPNVAGKTLLVSDGQDLSTPDLIRLIARAMNKKPRLLPVPPRALHLLGRMLGKQDEVERLCGSLCVDISETKRLLGWTPPHSPEEQIRRTVDHYLKQHAATAEQTRS